MGRRCGSLHMGTGAYEDIRVPMRELKRNPEAADAVRRAAPSSQIYGRPRFFKLFLEKMGDAG